MLGLQHMNSEEDTIQRIRTTIGNYILSLCYSSVKVTIAELGGLKELIYRKCLEQGPNSTCHQVLYSQPAKNGF